MANVNSNDVVVPIDKGLLVNEVKRFSAVAALAGLNDITPGATHVYHTFTAGRGKNVAEGETKTNTGVTVNKLEVHSTKFVRLYEFSFEAVSANKALFDQVMDTQANLLAEDFDLAVAGELPVTSGITFDTLRGINEVSLNNSEDFWGAVGNTISVSGANADGVLITAPMLAALKGRKTNGVADFNIEGDFNQGVIEGLKYAVLRGSTEKFAVVGPWATRSVAALGNPRSSVNELAMDYWVNNEVGALVEVWGGFRFANKSEFTKLTVA